MRALLAGLLIVACSFHSAGAQLQSRDIDLDGVVDAYYDPDQDLSFSADADPAGLLGLRSAESFAASASIAGLGGWRLPGVTALACPDPQVPVDCFPAESELSLLGDFSLFRDVQSSYWLGTFLEPRWYAIFKTASRSYSRADDVITPGANVWLVRDGDVGQTSPIPEPSTYALLLIGMAALALRTRRHREEL